MESVTETNELIDINDIMNEGDNNFKEEIFDNIYNDNTEASYMNFIFCPTLHELFKKYNYDIEKITYTELYKLSEEPNIFKNYAIDYRGGAIGELIINYSHPYDKDTDADAWVSLYLKRFPLTQLLKLHVNIPSWIYYGSNKTEEEITNDLYKLLI